MTFKWPIDPDGHDWHPKIFKADDPPETICDFCGAKLVYGPSYIDPDTCYLKRDKISGPIGKCPGGPAIHHYKR